MSDLAKLEKKMDKRFDEIITLMHKHAEDVSTRFDKQDARFDQQDAHFDRIEERLDRQDERMDQLLNTIDGFIKRIDDYETELAARDHKIDRLERWIQELASEAGVTLS